ncbi:PTS sugar transporter subunit IIABC [Mycoplasmopsis felis]|uniref:PTS glucose transporter subunit IIB n=1 Tax=Mycoplasmopsis felis TaxID=33923 RepID=A0A809RU16_9BACT|nr:PTS sugar transporter subunit IIABC [Mycoplasmopsis felis]WQQ07266.1 PTS sugar transporter subunit IIABC [Mycoplasmopsis felis]BBU47531.1 hypothetical protein JPM2_2240 [Mycoplasmopsis felis]
MKKQFKLFFYSILTFGLIWIKWRKKSNQHQKNTIYQIETMPFKIETLLSIIELQKIQKVELKPSRINIYISEVHNINTSKLAELKGVSGVFVRSNSISLTLGEYSTIVAKALNDKLKER